MDLVPDAHLDTRHMRHVVALADTLHFGHAAARMNMSQPPFSRQIAAIEQSLGVRLFERSSRAVSLTTAGRHFAEDCRRVLAGFDAACRDVRLVADGMKGELKLGFTMYSAQNVVPALVRRYAEFRPDVRLVLEERIPTDLDDMLIEGRLDAAVTFGAGSHNVSHGPSGLGRLHGGTLPHLQTVPLARDCLCLVVPDNHPLATRDDIGPGDLDGERLIAAPATVAPVLRAAITSYCAAGGVKPLIVLEPRLQHTIIRLVAERLGVALIPQSLCHDLERGPKGHVAGGVVGGVSGGVSGGVVARPLTDAPEFDVILCALAASQNPTVAALMQLARQT